MSHAIVMDALHAKIIIIFVQNVPQEVQILQGNVYHVVVQDVRNVKIIPQFVQNVR